MFVFTLFRIYAINETILKSKKYMLVNTTSTPSFNNGGSGAVGYISKFTFTKEWQKKFQSPQSPSEYFETYDALTIVVNKNPNTGEAYHLIPQLTLPYGDDLGSLVAYQSETLGFAFFPNYANGSLVRKYGTDIDFEKQYQVTYTSTSGLNFITIHEQSPYDNNLMAIEAVFDGNASLVTNISSYDDVETFLTEDLHARKTSVDGVRFAEKVYEYTITANEPTQNNTYNINDIPQVSPPNNHELGLINEPGYYLDGFDYHCSEGFRCDSNVHLLLAVLDGKYEHDGRVQGYITGINDYQNGDAIDNSFNVGETVAAKTGYGRVMKANEYVKLGFSFSPNQNPNPGEVVNPQDFTSGKVTIRVRLKLFTPLSN